MTDTFVKINNRTGIATEFPTTGIDTAANGLSFDEVNYPWNVDTARFGIHPTQTAYPIDPFAGNMLASVPVFPPKIAALGAFNLPNNLYYGLNFSGLSAPTFVEVPIPAWEP